ncbi:YwdI family protein [Jeotgalibacillus haloalkalitolerans]|uniref:YwdI family protein n=1 Tax=Jeotgalibacillus haloalkalitolerans TaxID=3104292 RepID=A0ABU5KIS9_9BACL|nr:YwdI family protein [Jeotgalibacillus sp. HH7-29]MDZ5711157.1 YwdI family protein [Jeotgalibacillus sp. HH7-29]
MNISYEQLLQKISQEANKAQGAAPGRQREHLRSIQTLCELALGQEESAPAPGRQPQPPVQPVMQPQQVQSYQQPSPLQEKPIETDGGNGDSLFDF